ncbi:MAG: hypothetical protein WBG01_09030 [Bacteroidota bacterium]
MARRKRTAAVEYRLLVTPGWNDRLQEPTTIVVLETVQTFASFRYALSVEEERGRRSLLYKVMGLNAPDLSLSASGEAQYTREYEDLVGTIEITVQGLDGERTSCTLRVSPERVRVVKEPSGAQLAVLTKRSEWEKRNRS